MSIFNYIIHDEFSDCVSVIEPGDGLTLTEFENSDLSNDLVLDRSHMFTDDNIYDGSHLFKLFGSFCDRTEGEIRSMVITEADTAIDFYANACKVALWGHRKSMQEWISFMSHTGVRGDNICIFILGVLFQRHIMVVTRTLPWSTVNTNCLQPTVSLYSHCTTHLLHLGNNLFGLLKPKPNFIHGEQQLTFPLSVNVPEAKRLPASPIEHTENLELLSEIAGVQQKLAEPDDSIASSSRNNTHDGNEGSMIPDSTLMISPSPAETEGGKSSGCNKNAFSGGNPVTPRNNSDDDLKNKPAMVNVTYTGFPNVINNDCLLVLTRLKPAEIAKYTAVQNTQDSKAEDWIESTSKTDVEPDPEPDSNPVYSLRKWKPSKPASSRPSRSHSRIVYTEVSSGS